MCSDSDWRGSPALRHRPPSWRSTSTIYSRRQGHVGHKPFNNFHLQNLHDPRATHSNSSITSLYTSSQPQQCRGKVSSFRSHRILMASLSADFQSNSIRRPEVHTAIATTYRGIADIRLSSLIGTGNIDKAAIFNSEGNSVWATSAGFTVRPPYPIAEHDPRKSWVSDDCGRDPSKKEHGLIS